MKDLRKLIFIYFLECPTQFNTPSTAKKKKNVISSFVFLLEPQTQWFKMTTQIYFRKVLVVGVQNGSHWAKTKSFSGLYVFVVIVLLEALGENHSKGQVYSLDANPCLHVQS